MDNKNVLLTGVTGFLGSHTAIALLERGYKVTGTLRNKERIGPITKIIGRHTTKVQNLELVEADLNDEFVWKELTRDKDYVQHIASPFPRKLPKNEEELIAPAKSGTLNILHASLQNKVKRVVMTSSVAAVAYGKTKDDLKKVFNESVWTDEQNKQDSTPYYRSKTIAEKAAWQLINQTGSELELTTVLPGAILGPVLEDDFGTSANIIIKILDGSSPALPKIGFDIIDVRSVADLLIRAMEMPQAANQRYIASSGYLTFKDIAMILKEHYPHRKIPTSQLSNYLVRLFSNFDTSLKPILLDLGIKRNLDITKAAKELQWHPRSAQEAVLSCAESVIKKGIVK
ncbi:aldehyde reductase [Chitinophaga sp. S165]|uniref:SDR family oxidoreductase n=1 Tax=Chitinophaga sp. S165 TaxID=2135462 RepID=UPI000D710EA1|nr:aldehyde reductase [Chitinophaga sp. S165]PWV54350.1 nucleoside-diphosphate-sugar epimerase [Chitinophaga sp. S165]